jgi:hypothetical protein
VKQPTEGTHWDAPLSINLNINKENQDWKIGTVCAGQGSSGKEKGEGRRLRWWYMVDGLHICLWSSWGGKGTKGERLLGQCK